MVNFKTGNFKQKNKKFKGSSNIKEHLIYKNNDEKKDSEIKKKISKN